ncbi:pseudaminic acid cytidylyltransferase [Shewanella polaris]|uniref:Pseudaminic acid cytidylyltransferase n=1 Tax=Shewanella polaris TaxID=2588449 RepID=A0A4Y5YCM7_9GAMM|nr:pseudaminic acid cytidylyltransferase [Shewanella polaris]QDE30502.1 pseudaminic acid cytidylyltransferase [Shewanella polaris]
MTRILAIIPARAGSKRIPGKNLKNFLGKEIISYPIKALLAVNDIDTVIVSTDSEKIKSIALNYGASVPFIRSKKNSDDFATTFDVIEEVLSNCDRNFDLVCCVYPTSVFVTSNMLSEAIQVLQSNATASSIASVLEYSHPIQRSLIRKDGFLVSNHPECYNMRSQDLAVNYHDAGQFYIFKPDVVMTEKRLITDACIPFVINPNDAHDIDTIDDWKLAELKYKFKTHKVNK